MSFDDEMNDVSKAETTGGYINSIGVKLVTLKKYAMSPKDHKGKPYIEFTFELAEGTAKDTSSTRLYRVTKEDTPEVKQWKNKKIKELLTNAGADWSEKGENIIKTAVGGTLKVLFKKSEFVGKNKNENNRPTVKTKVEYSFSLPSSDARKDSEFPESYFNSTLSDKDRAKYEGELAIWNRDNDVPTEPVVQGEVDANTPPSDEDDDLPF